MKEVLNLTYNSSLSDICEENSSFDKGIIRIAYPGKNRNGSCIEKDTFEKCLNSIYNCPVVCSYNRDDDTIGGHDVAIVSDDDGGLKLINLTVPVGCIPESSKVYWETVEEEDGTEREYLCAEALLWKRQEAYQKIKKDGVTAQSMEITVKEAETEDDVYTIKDFEFTAFALIGVEPCFESASLSFQKNEFKKEFAEMMEELKSSFSKVDPSKEDDIDNNTEGGEETLDKEVVSGEVVETEEVIAEVEETAESHVETAEVEPEEVHEAEEVVEETPAHEDFALNSNIADVLRRAVHDIEVVHREWGDYPAYWMADFDAELHEVYCWNDGVLYGFEYDVAGDSVIIKEDSKKRKKYEIVDFEGSEPTPVSNVFELINNGTDKFFSMKKELEASNQNISELKSELECLKQFKNEKITEAKKEIISNFEELNGIEEFELLKNSVDQYSEEDLEEKCFAIKGRSGIISSQNSKIMIDKFQNEDEPYGGLFKKYGVVD